MYNQYSRKYDEWCKCYDHSDIEMTVIKKYVSFKNKSILEIGCGTGRFTNKLVQEAVNRIVAIDNDLLSINYAKEHYPHNNVEYTYCDANDINNNFQNQHFDIIIFSWSANYIDHLKSVLEKSYGLLSPDGKIVITYTWLGDYEKIMQSFFLDKEINMNNYNLSKIIFLNFGMNITEDIIETEFTFDGIIDAMDKNLFFWDLENIKLNVTLIDKIRDKLLEFQDDGGKIVMNDCVKLLIGYNISAEISAP
jgi:SAM-dependent methyltransferase